MRWFTARSIISIGILTGLPTLTWLVLPASPSRSQTPAALVPEAEDASELHQLVSEILLIRQRQGTLFQGTLLDAPGPDGTAAGESAGHRKREFEQALRQVAGSQPLAPQLPLNPPPATIRSATRGFSTSASASPVTPQQTEPPQAGSLQYQHGRNEVEAPHRTLLDAGRALEERAALLEEEGSFDSAERLRRLARRIRHEARQWAEAAAPDGFGS